MLRMIGAVLLMTGSSTFGFSLAAHERKQERMLRQLMKVINEMEWELKFRLTPLPELCRNCAGAAEGELRKLFHMMADRLCCDFDTDPEACMNGLLSEVPMPLKLKRCLRSLGRILGRFDLEGQLQGFQEVRQQCRNELDELNDNGKERIRCYQTLALCAGAGLVILFV